MSRQPPRGARGAYYQRQVMAALDCVAMYQRAFGQSPTLTEVAVLMGVSVPRERPGSSRGSGVNLGRISL